MNLNVGNGASAIRNPKEAASFDLDFDRTFVSPFASRRGSEEPQLRSVSGRSMPRLMKVRKNAGSQRARSRSVSEAQVDAQIDFNPFLGGSASVDDNSAMQELRDRYRSWNPFQSVQKSKGSNSSANSSVSGDIEGSKPDDTGFVFGASCSSSASNSFTEKNNFMGESMGLADEIWKLNIRSGIGAKDADKGRPFVFGSNSKSQSGLEENPMSASSSNLPDEMRKLNMEDLDAVDRPKETKFSTTTNSKYSFVFESSGNVAGMDNGNAASSLPDETRKLNIKNLQFGVDDETKGVHSSFTTNDKSSFVFGSSGNASSANTNLPDKLKKLNIEETTNVGGFEKVKDGNFSSNVHDKKFVFGSNKSDFSSSVGTSASILPEEMKKLNIEGSGVGHKSEEAKNDGFTINRKDPFVFGSKKDVSSASRSTMNKLPDEMKKLNIEGKIEDPGDTPAKVFPSSTMFEKNSQRGKSSDSTIHEPTFGNSIPTSFSFNTSNTKVGASPNTQSDDPKSNEASMPSYSFSSTGASFKSATSVFEAPTVDRIENKAEFSFTSTVDQFGTTHKDFKTPKPDPSSCSAGNLFVGLDRKLDFSVNKGSVKDTKVKKKRGKVRRPASVLPSAGQNYRSRESSSQENPESPGRCSPMDFSPYQETLAADPSTRGTSVTSDEYFHFDGECPATEAQRSVSVDTVDEDLITATQSFGISEIGKNYGNLHEEQSRDHSENGADAEFPSQEFTVKEGSETSESKPEDMDARSDTSGFANEFEAGFRSNIESKENDGRMQFCFKSSSEDFSGSNFTFAASTSGQGHVSSVKRQQRKKNRSKASQDSYNSSSNATMQFASPSIPLFPLAGSSFQSGNGQNKVGDSSMSERKGENKVAADKGLKQGHIITAAAIVAAQEACEKWRLRGNQAYANGNLLTAEEYYTRGVNCVSVNETSKGCLNALVLCYSNRAAARMSAGRMREALMDCTKAALIDPDFVKVQLRAANCHLALGETKNALKYFKNCVPSGDFVCLDRKIVIEASNGLQKAQHVADYLDRCAELLRQRTSNDAEGALQLIAEALSISPYSENLIEMKAEALFMLRRYDEVIQLCEQSLDYAEKNFPSEIDDSRLENMNNSGSERNSMARFWRWPLIARSYFNLGRLKESLSFLEKLEQEEIDSQMFRGKDASAALAATIRELLCHKAAGNEAFQSGRHAEAVEHYTSALSCNIESRPFAAICFCNRAATYQALGQITDAIADCSLAIALDGNYAKAISRRSTLHEMIRDYGQAAVDLQRLVSLNEKQVEDKSKDLGKLGRSNSSIIDIRQVSSRLSSVEEEERKGISLNFYLILGIESSATASDIKKAYRKAALRHHPDKAGQFLARNDNGDDKLWKEIAEEIHKDADRLFKMIGEAYAILSDPSKRSQYDFEEIRSAKKKVNECSNSRAYSDYPNYPFERSGSRRQWKDVRRSNRNQSPQW